MNEFFNLVFKFFSGFFSALGGILLTPEYKPIYVGVVALILLIYTLYEMFISKENDKFYKIAALYIGAFLGLIGAMK